MLKTVLCWSVLAIRKNWTYLVALINSTWRRIGGLIYVKWPFVKLMWQGYCGYSSYVNDALLLARRTRKCSKHFCIDASCLTKLCHVSTLLSLYIKHGQQCRFFFCINLGFKQFKQYANGEHCACSSCTNSKNNKKRNCHSQMKKKILSKCSTSQILQGLFHNAAFNSTWRTQLLWTVRSYKQGTVVVIWLLVVSITHYTCYTLQSVIKLVLCV